jgi:hypothetical protein
VLLVPAAGGAGSLLVQIAHASQSVSGNAVVGLIARQPPRAASNNQDKQNRQQSAVRCCAIHSDEVMHRVPRRAMVEVMETTLSASDGEGPQ